MGDVFTKRSKFKSTEDELKYYKAENAEMVRVHEEEYLPRKVAAGEVLKPRKMLKIAGSIGMGISFLSAVATNLYGFVAGGTVSLLGIGSLFFIMYKNEMEIRRLKSTYGLENVTIIKDWARKLNK